MTLSPSTVWQAEVVGSTPNDPVSRIIEVKGSSISIALLSALHQAEDSDSIVTSITLKKP